MLFAGKYSLSNGGSGVKDVREMSAISCGRVRDTGSWGVRPRFKEPVCGADSCSGGGLWTGSWFEGGNDLWGEQVCASDGRITRGRNCAGVLCWAWIVRGNRCRVSAMAAMAASATGVSGFSHRLG